MRLLPSLAALLALAGCAESRVEQCNRFVAVYNTTAPEIAKAGAELASPEASPDTVYTTLTRLGELEGTLARETRALKLADAALTAHLEGFAASAEHIQTSMDAAVKAGKAGDPNSTIVALANYSKYAGEQDHKVAEIRAYCAGEPPPPPPEAFPTLVDPPAADPASPPVGSPPPELPADAAVTPTMTLPNPAAAPVDPGADLPVDDTPAR